MASLTIRLLARGVFHFNFQRCMIDIKMFKRVLCFMLNAFDGTHVCFLSNHNMACERILRRAERPHMNMVKVLYTIDLAHVFFYFVDINIFGHTVQ